MHAAHAVSLARRQAAALPSRAARAASGRAPSVACAGANRALHSTAASREQAQESSSASKDAAPSTSRRFEVPPAPGAPGGKKGPRVGTLFLGLTLCGLAVTAYGLAEYFGTFKTWPKEVRDDLRTAIKARDRGDARRAEAHFRRALATARALPAAKLGGAGERLLKISGISIALGSLLEGEHEYAAAYKAYAESLDELLAQGEFAAAPAGAEPGSSSSGSSSSGTVMQEQAQQKSLTPQERMRTVALAQKLGDLAASGLIEDALSGSEPSARGSRSGSGSGAAAGGASASAAAAATMDALAERHYVWSVEELLRLVMSEEQRKAQAASASARSGSSSDGETLRPAAAGDGAPPASPGSGGSASASASASAVVLSDLGLPAWISPDELGASLEALAGFYARKRRADLAVPLYLQALSLLMPAEAGISAGAAMAGRRDGAQAGSAVEGAGKGTQRRKQPTASERCRAGVLMNNLAQLLLEGGEGLAVDPASSPSSSSSSRAPAPAPAAPASNAPADADKARQARAWILKGLDVVQRTQSMAGWDALPGAAAASLSASSSPAAADATSPSASATASAPAAARPRALVESSPERTAEVCRECAAAEIALLYNLGAVSERLADRCGARDAYMRAYARADQHSLRHARNTAAAALAALERRGGAGGR